MLLRYQYITSILFNIHELTIVKCNNSVKKLFTVIVDISLHRDASNHYSLPLTLQTFVRYWYIKMHHIKYPYKYIIS